MNNATQVIVYRSQFEQQNDQFWANHPEYVLIGLGVLIVVILGKVIYDKYY